MVFVQPQTMCTCLNRTKILCVIIYYWLALESDGAVFDLDVISMRMHVEQKDDV